MSEQDITDKKSFRRERMMRIIFLVLIAVEILSLFLMLAMFGDDDSDLPLGTYVAVGAVLLFGPPLILCEFRIYGCLRHFILTDKNDRSRLKTFHSIFSLLLASLVLIVYVSWAAAAAEIHQLSIVIDLLYQFMQYNEVELFMLILGAAEFIDVMIVGIFKLRQWSGDYESENTSSQK